MLFITLFTANQIALQKTKKIALKSRLRFVCSAATYVTQFGGDLEQKRLDLECPSRLSRLTAATPRSRPSACSSLP